MTCVSTAPKPTVLASVWRENGNSKFGQANVGEDVRCVFRAAKAMLWASAHSDVWFLRVKQAPAGQAQRTAKTTPLKQGDQKSGQSRAGTYSAERTRHQQGRSQTNSAPTTQPSIPTTTLAEQSTPSTDGYQRVRPAPSSDLRFFWTPEASSPPTATVNPWATTRNPQQGYYSTAAAQAPTSAVWASHSYVPPSAPPTAAPLPPTPSQTMPAVTPEMMSLLQQLVSLQQQAAAQQAPAQQPSGPPGEPPARAWGTRYPPRS
ncbi:mucin-7-like [Diachasma alloeum]|uniref:mucin-7-like n=1 Tax=Diachasma alloeum TaxID=454923 RepID=UPI0007382D5E|nr:mucin-7-like [Diachasma alloeum]